MPNPDDVPDVLPAWANSLLAACWILLFGGRWIVVNLLIGAGLLTFQTPARLDRMALLPLYLVLFILTFVVVALRAVRGARLASQPTATVVDAERRAEISPAEATDASVRQKRKAP